MPEVGNRLMEIQGFRGPLLHAPQARTALHSLIQESETLHLKSGGQCLCLLKGNPGHWGKGLSRGGGSTQPGKHGDHEKR